MNTAKKSCEGLKSFEHYVDMLRAHYEEKCKACALQMDDLNSSVENDLTAFLHRKDVREANCLALRGCVTNSFLKTL